MAIVAAVVDRTGGEHGLGLAQQLLDAQQVAVAQHDLSGVILLLVRST